MTKESILREIERGTSINELPLRVTFYARVSTEKDAQLNSLENQIEYFKNKIKSNPQWEYVDGYIDEGKSGGQAEKRPEFMKMINDAKAGKFDLILTKEISRFARNTVDSLTYTKELYRYGVGVKFDSDGFTTFEKDGNLRLTIMSSIAEDELRKLSERIKFGHRQAVKKGVVLGNNRIWGYKKNNGRLEIVEDEAEMVRLIFDLYATGKYGFKEIERILYGKGYRNLKGKKICHSTLSAIVRNPKYKGYYVGGKSYSSDYIEKIPVPVPEDNWTIYKDETGDIVPAIVSEEIWEKANEILMHRSADVISRQNQTNHANLLTGKMICTHCGLPYYRKDARLNTGEYHSIWRCSGKINNGAKSCPSFSIYEDEIKPVLLELFTDVSIDIDGIVEHYCTVYKRMMDTSDLPKLLESKKESLERCEEKKRKLLDYLLDGTLSKRDYHERNEYLSAEAEKLREDIAEIDAQILSKDDFEEIVEELRRNLTEAIDTANTGLIDKDFVDRYIESIAVTAESDVAELKVKIFTGEERVFFYQHSPECRTGQMSKKMIQAYEEGNK